MTYTQTEKEQLIKYAKQSISLFPSTKNPDHRFVASFCFDLAEAMIEEQRKRFGS